MVIFTSQTKDDTPPNIRRSLNIFERDPLHSGNNIVVLERKEGYSRRTREKASAHPKAKETVIRIAEIRIDLALKRYRCVVALGLKQVD